MEGIQPMSRAFQIDSWPWDVFVCHAGPDKLFVLALKKRLPVQLRCFVDKESLLVGDHATECIEHACMKTQIAVVLLAHAFFHSEDAQTELQWILENCMDGRSTLVPVFLGVTADQCKTLAIEAGRGLEKVCEYTGLRHMCERRTVDGRPVTREDTMRDLVYRVRALTGV